MLLAAAGLGLAAAPACAQEPPFPQASAAGPPWAAAATSLALPALAYAAAPFTGGVGAVVAPALVGGGHLVAGVPRKGVAYSLLGGALGVGAYYAGATWLAPGGAGAGAAAATWVGVPFVLLAAYDAHGEAARRVVPPADAPVAPLAPLTRADYAKLAGGASFDEVLAVLGRPGRRVDASRTQGLPTESWRWTNPDGSYLELTFQGQRLVAKAQRGLPAP